MPRDGVKVSVRNASLEDLEKEASQLESMYEVYRSLSKIGPIPDDVRMDLEVRGTGDSDVELKGVTGERLLADATRYRILNGLRDHVVNNAGWEFEFTLAFTLSWRIEDPELQERPGTIGRVVR
jgi:hypothetical protein